MDAVLAAAVGKEGLTKWGPGDFQEPLAVLLDDYPGAGLNVIGVGTGTASVNYPSYWNTSGVMNNLGTMTAAAAGATLLVQTVPSCTACGCGFAPRSGSAATPRSSANTSRRPSWWWG